MVSGLVGQLDRREWGKITWWKLGQPGGQFRSAYGFESDPPFPFQIGGLLDLAEETQPFCQGPFEIPGTYVGGGRSMTRLAGEHFRGAFAIAFRQTRREVAFIIGRAIRLQTHGGQPLAAPLDLLIGKTMPAT